MSRTQIKVNELEAFARQIGKAEQECDQALDTINWHFNSLLANFPGAVPGHIHNLEADFKYSIKRYKSKLDDAQRLVKLTAAKMEEADRKMSGKVGNFLLELVGWYDLQRLAGEYDPVTGEKLSSGDKTLAAIMLGLSIFPPAKAVGVGGKVAVAGAKAGKAGAKVDFSMFAKDPKIFTSIRNVLDTGKVLQAFKKVYNDVVVGPLAATKVWFDSVIKKLGDLPIPMNLQVQLAGVGAYRKTIGEAFQEAKEQISRIVVGKSTGNAKHLDDVPRLKEIEVNFNRNNKHDPEEFARQLKDQEKGMNELTVDEYLKNRERYIAEGRAIEGNAAQKMARQEALKDKIAELRRQGLSRTDATKQATEWLDKQAALHNPDQIAGGKVDIIGGLGDKRINSSIGSQWKYRIDVVDEQIRESAKNMAPEQLANTYLNVKLTQ